ncbi:MAG: 4Fe-4S binding protein, partial [Candidatus Ranarchaeia archaeon]
FKKYTGKPIILKVPPSRTIHTTLKETVEAGVDAIIAIDGISGMRVNIDTGVPLLGGEPEKQLIIGRPIFPVAVYTIFKIAKVLKEMGREDVPIIGGGGIAQGADCIEMLMVGASGYSACTGIILGGGIPTITKYVNEIEGILTRMGVKHVHDVKDKTHEFFADWSLDQVVKEAIPPSVDPTLCIACGLCAASCPVQCIEILEIAEIDVSKCIGCALCVSRCPVDALQLPYMQMMPKRIRNFP